MSSKEEKASQGLVTTAVDWQGCSPGQAARQYTGPHASAFPSSVTHKSSRKQWLPESSPQTPPPWRRQACQSTNRASLRAVIGPAAIGDCKPRTRHRWRASSTALRPKRSRTAQATGRCCSSRLRLHRPPPPPTALPTDRACTTGPEGPIRSIVLPFHEALRLSRSNVWGAHEHCYFYSFFFLFLDRSAAGNLSRCRFHQSVVSCRWSGLHQPKLQEPLTAQHRRPRGQPRPAKSEEATARSARKEVMRRNRRPLGAWRRWPEPVAKSVRRERSWSRPKRCGSGWRRGSGRGGWTRAKALSWRASSEP